MSLLFSIAFFLVLFFIFDMALIGIWCSLVLYNEYKNKKNADAAPDQLPDVEDEKDAYDTSHDIIRPSQ